MATTPNIQPGTVLAMGNDNRWSLTGYPTISHTLYTVSRTYGPRITASSDLPVGTRLRVVVRQPETLHSQLSRMLKRAHKDAMREP